MNRDATYIRQILDAIDKIEKYIVEEDDFFKSTLVQDAIIRNLEIIGEVSKRISEAYKMEHRDVPWRKMAGIRDVLIHDYDSIDLTIVWNVVSVELEKISGSLMATDI